MLVGRQSIIGKIAWAGSSGIRGWRQPRYETAARASSALVNGTLCCLSDHTNHPFPMAARAACLMWVVSILDFHGALDSMRKETVRKRNVLFMQWRKVAARTISSLLDCLSSSGYHFSNTSATCSCKPGSTSSSIGSSLLSVRSIGARACILPSGREFGWDEGPGHGGFSTCAFRKASASNPPPWACTTFRDQPLLGLGGALLARMRVPEILALGFLARARSGVTGLPGGKVPFKPADRTLLSWSQLGGLPCSLPGSSTEGQCFGRLSGMSVSALSSAGMEIRLRGLACEITTLVLMGGIPDSCPLISTSSGSLRAFSLRLFWTILDKLGSTASCIRAWASPSFFTAALTGLGNWLPRPLSARVQGAVGLIATVGACTRFPAICPSM